MKNEIKTKLERIRGLISAAGRIYLTLPEEDRNKILEYHNHGATLPYCLRWGEQAAIDLCEKYEDIAQAKEAQED